MRESELILNPDGSVYHLSLLPEDLAPLIILVGDQNRVSLISDHFDKVDVKKHKREFITHTGWIGGRQLMVISTGIGTDNIDIVINELDALANVNLKTRELNNDLQSLEIIRIGTSGSIHPDVRIGDVVISQYAIGTDSLGQYYGTHQSPHHLLPPWSYLVKRGIYDLDNFPSACIEGVTITCPGFYAAQGRSIRLTPEYQLPVAQLHEISIHGFPVTNIEMEAAGIYLLSEKLDHKAICFNAIIAHRLDKKFAKDSRSHITSLIENVLQWITTRGKG